MPERLTIEIDHSHADDGEIVAHLTGELDLSTAPRLLQEMQAALFTGAPRELVLDFAGVDFLDSMGLRAIIDLANLMRGSGGVLVLEAMKPAARKVLEVTGMTEHLTLR